MKLKALLSPAKSLLLLLPFLLHSSAFAQRYLRSEGIFGEGSYTIAAGIGWGINHGYSDKTPGQPGYQISLDKGVIEMPNGTVGLGAFVGYKSGERTYYTNNYKANWTSVVAAGRATYHVTPLSEAIPFIDAYAGVILGLRYFSLVDEYNEAIGLISEKSSIHPYSGPFVGIKFNLAPSFGLWTEAGLDIALLKAGLHLNF